MIVICDIDGTIADNSRRLQFYGNRNTGWITDWDAFYADEQLATDTPIALGILGLNRLRKMATVVLMTGRPEKTRKATEAWLKANGLDGLAMYMRADGDHRPATVFKKETLEKILHFLSAAVPVILIDDDVRNFDMYQKYGLVLMAPDCWMVML